MIEEVYGRYEGEHRQRHLEVRSEYGHMVICQCLKKKRDYLVME